MQPQERKNLFDALLITFIFLLICWAVFLVDSQLGAELRKWGLRPRSVKGLWGIATVHFLHKDLGHIVNNTWAFLVLNTYLFFFYRNIAFKVLPRLLLFSGILLWLWGRPAIHIGASVAIYGIAVFLFFSGTFRKSLPLMAVSALVLFSYGSMFWGMFPIQPEMSWEGHLSGAVTGLALAYLYRQEGPQRKKYNWELEEEIEATTESDPENVIPDFNSIKVEYQELHSEKKQEEQNHESSSESDQNIIYHYKESGKKKPPTSEG